MTMIVSLQMTNIKNNTAQNSSDNLPSCQPPSQLRCCLSEGKGSWMPKWLITKA